MTAADALILAAGASRRFGAAPKQLAPLAGRPLLQHALDTALATATLDRIVLVLGAHAEEIERALDLGRAEVVVCAEWDEGQAASLRTGLTALAPAAQALVLLGDQPRVTPAAIEAVLAAGPGARAAYDGAPGHPAFLGPAHVASAQRLRGDTGLRAARWHHVEVGHLASDRDVDTPQDLEEIRREARAVL